ncbi:MAG TPA: response regulator [Ktedonosporobacter sp.]|nr:response regulator [Ktedonosporobacter sp.]
MAQVGLLEDNVRIANLCATMLQYAGHRVTIYEHPRKCLDALLATPGTGERWQQVPRVATSSDLPVDVLILDLNLPDITGMEVVNFLRAHQNTEALPLIFCTAATPAEVHRALRAAPGSSFLEKPFSFQELASAIATALKVEVR